MYYIIVKHKLNMSTIIEVVIIIFIIDSSCCIYNKLVIVTTWLKQNEKNSNSGRMKNMNIFFLFTWKSALKIWR